MLLAPHDAIFGRYQPSDLIAEGGEAYVFLGEDLILRTRVAVRQQKLDRSSSARFERMLARIDPINQLDQNHPNLLAPLAHGEFEGRYYAIYPYIEGNNLYDHVVHHGPLFPDFAIKVISQVAEAAEHLHKQRVVHRDIKPHNVLIEGRSASVCLIDLTAARIIDAKGSRSSSRVVGTPSWMAPEQAEHPDAVTSAADLYALAGLLFFLLTGELPIPEQSTPEAQFEALRTQTPRPPRSLNPSIPRHAEAATLAGLVKDPSSRPSIEEWLGMLKAPRSRARSGGENVGNGTPSAGPSCAHCHRAIRTGDRYCGSCGMDQSGQTTPALRCLSCLGPVSGGTLSQCPNCDRPLRAPLMELRVGDPVEARYLVPLGEFTIGRRELAPTQPRISRRQLTLRSTDDGITVRDCARLNPVRVDGSPLTSSTELRPGSRVVVADTSCELAFTQVS